MFESEIYIKTVAENLPADILGKFKATATSFKRKSILHWTEHCTECSMPDCFKTCDLYTPRIDGKCQRFVNGIERIQLDNEAAITILKINFKKWGVFATQGNSELFLPEEVQKEELKDLKIASLIHLPWPALVKKKFAQKRYSVKKNHIIHTQNRLVHIPDAFLVEVYNPSGKDIFLDLTLRNDDEKYRKLPFQYRIALTPGYNKEIIPFSEIEKRIKVDASYRINLTPESISTEIPLYFGITDFVQFQQQEVKDQKATKVKCVVWDLDNTIWDGILMEDGVEGLTLKEGIKEILYTIEQKGIINSIASKNSVEPAMSALKHFGLDEYFLFPKISWGSKSKAIKDIALDLNISVNTILFMDDSIFERNEVESLLPQVSVLDAVEYQSLLGRKEFQIPVTEESKRRKQFYVTEVQRKDNSEAFEGEYLEFLKSCEIRLEILPLDTTYFDRVYELTQRTNQMNFSGNRYQHDDVSAISKDNDLEAYVLKCTDKFGAYGIIGFGIIKKSENRLIDLMFSCRIQSKRVEHAFITYCLGKYLEFGDFFVTYKHTEKNKFSAQVFHDFGFEIIEENDGIRQLKFTKEKTFLDDNIITIKAH